APRSQISNKTVTLTTEEHHVHPEIDLMTLQSGRYGDLQDLRNDALDALRGFRYSKIWSTLVGSVATSDPNYWSVASTASSAVKKNALDSGIDYVADVINNAPTAIIGRRNALQWLADYSMYP